MAHFVPSCGTLVKKSCCAKSRIASQELQVKNCKSRIASQELQVKNCKSRIASQEMQKKVLFIYYIMQLRPTEAKGVTPYRLASISKVAQIIELSYELFLGALCGLWTRPGQAIKKILYNIT
jgi:hypothetical protein